MPTLWFWLGISFLGFVAGVLMISFLFISVKMKDKYKQRKIPKDKTKIKEYVNYNKDFFKTGTPVEIDEKEVVENDRRNREKFREFEKLRRLASSEKPIGRKGITSSSSPGDTKLEGGKFFSNEPDKIDTREYSESKRRIKLD